VVGVEVGEEHRLQPGEVESRADESGRRTAAAVDDEDSLVDDERRGDPAAAGDGHGGARRSQEDQFGGHVHLLFPLLADDRYAMAQWDSSSHWRIPAATPGRSP
jgi:hypothetical protein